MERDPGSGAGDVSRRFHVDGDLVPADEAAVSVRDRGFLYGDAAVETLRVYGGTPFRWDAHAERLVDTCETLGIPVGSGDLSASGLRTRVRETLAANDLADARARLSVTRGEGDGVTPPPAADTDPTVVITVAPLPRGGAESPPVWDGPAALQTAKTRRVPDRSVPSDAKTHGHLDAVLASAETRVSDADEAVLLDAAGDVTGCATANLFFVADDALRTPALDGSAFPGVTRATVLDIARAEGFPVETGRYAPDDVRAADEAFVTSTVDEVRPVGTYDGVEIGGGSGSPDPATRETDVPGGPVTRLVARLYDERVERACYGAGAPAGTGAGGAER